MGAKINAMTESLLLLSDKIMDNLKVIFWVAKNKKVKLHPVFKLFDEYLKYSRILDQSIVDDYVNEIEEWPSSSLMEKEKFELVKLFTRFYLAIAKSEFHLDMSVRVQNVTVVRSYVLKDDIRRVFYIIENIDKATYPFFLVLLDVLATNVEDYIKADVPYPKEFDVKTLENLVSEIHNYVDKYIALAK